MLTLPSLIVSKSGHKARLDCVNVVNRYLFIRACSVRHPLGDTALAAIQLQRSLGAEQADDTTAAVVSAVPALPAINAPYVPQIADRQLESLAELIRFSVWRVVYDLG